MYIFCREKIQSKHHTFGLKPQIKNVKLKCLKLDFFFLERISTTSSFYSKISFNLNQFSYETIVCKSIEFDIYEMKSYV